MRMAEPPHCVKTSKMTGGTIPKQNRMRYSSNAHTKAIFTIMATVVFHCSGSAVPSVLRRHGIYPYCKFISILWNFCSAFIGGASAIGVNSIALGLLNKSSRMVCDHAKNVLRMPKGDTPWRTPKRLNRKPYLDTAIVSRLNISLP